MRAIFHDRWQSLHRRIGFWQHGLTNLVFPPGCVSCCTELDEPISTDLLLCPNCLDEIEVFARPMCAICGAPVPTVRSSAGVVRSLGSQPGCYRCRGRKLWFDAAITLGPYVGRLRELLLRMKSASGDAISQTVGHLLYRTRCDQLAAAEADVVTPIPLHWRRRIVHRTNSASLLAHVLASKLRVPLAEGLLRRSRATARQFDLSPPQRWENVRRAFTVRAGHHLSAAHVLLVDDILTTGATCSEAARALRAAGAARVTVAVVARAFGESQ